MRRIIECTSLILLTWFIPYQLISAEQIKDIYKCSFNEKITGGYLDVDESGIMNSYIYLEKSWLFRKKRYVIINGNPTKKYDIIDNFIISENGKNYAFIGKKNNHWSGTKYFVIYNGKEVETDEIKYMCFGNNKLGLIVSVSVIPYDDSYLQGVVNIIFSVDADYKSNRIGEIRRVESATPFMSTEEIIMNSILTSYAYVEHQKEKIIVFKDDEPYDVLPNEAYNKVTQISYDSNENSIYYIVEKSNGKYAAVIDGVFGPEYDFIDSLCVSQTDNNYAYISYSGLSEGEKLLKNDIILDSSKSTVIYNGKKGKEYKHINGLQFTEDGKHFMYFVYDGKEEDSLIYSPTLVGGKWYMIIDNVYETNKYSSIRKVLYEPNSEKIALVVAKKGPDIPSFLNMTNPWFLVTNAYEYGPFNHVETMCYDNKGGSIAYAVNEGGEWVKDYSTYAPKGGKYYLYIDDECVSGPHNLIFSVVYNEKESTFTYLAQDGRRIFLGKIE